MNLRITILFFLLINYIAVSQNQFEPGTVYYQNGTVEKGYIQFFPKESNRLLFKKSETDETHTLSSNQIKSYIFENFDKKFVSEKIDTDFYFLEVLVEGTANLLFLKNNGTKRRYFLKSKKTGLKELDIILRKNEAQNKQFKLKRYIGILNLEFNDCEKIKNKLDNIKLISSDLSTIFIEYNNCVAKTTFVSERKQRKNIHQLGLEAGAYYTKVKSRGTSIRGKDFESSITPSIGLNYLFTPTSISSRISLVAGVSYNQINTETAYYRNVPVLIGDFETSKITLKTINFKLGGIYGFNESRKKINPYLGIYYINSLLLNSDPIDSYIRIDTTGNESFLYEDFVVETQKITSGFAIEIGANLVLNEKNELTVKIGYERIGDFLNYSGASYPSDSIALKFGYNFDL
ncbi:hypothetical protein [Aquimarina pacifica]|uniref:hypothetical protein n=1 Tax=Aquimarina pacifica TaxID=1296415 RepID=UPI0004720FA4|nr:hypothetical protein [Aquimarina pacifica]